MVCFLTLASIKKNFKTLDAYNRASSCRKAMFLHVVDDILRRLSKTPDGKIHFQEFLDESTHIFKYHRHCHKVYKTGKRFSRNSWFELDAEWLAENFKEENFNTATCGFLTKEYHKWIDKRVYFKRQKTEGETITGEEPMTSREFARYNPPTVITHPDNDIPDDIPEEKPAARPVAKAVPPSDDLPDEAEEKPITLDGLQRVIDHRNISYGFAKLVQKCLGLEGELKDHPRGFSIQDPDRPRFKAGNIALSRKLGRLSKIQPVDEKFLEKIKTAAA